MFFRNVSEINTAVCALRGDKIKNDNGTCLFCDYDLNLKPKINYDL